MPINGDEPAQDALVHTPIRRRSPHQQGARRRRDRDWIDASSAASSCCGTRWTRCGIDYDFLFIDCPPSLELLTLNALCAADSLLVPLQGEYYALEGLSDLMNTVRIVRRNMNPRLQIEGVLLTMFDGRTNLAIQVAQEVKRFFPGKVYSTVIPRNVRLSEAPSHGKPITAYDRLCRGAEAYMNLSAEFLKRKRLTIRERRSAMANTSKGLGKGLAALLGDDVIQAQRKRAASTSPSRRWRAARPSRASSLTRSRCPIWLTPSASTASFSR